MSNVVQVGIGVIIKNSASQVLLGKRKNAHGEGEWSFSGGKPNVSENFFDAAKREVFEETGLIVKKLERTEYWTDDYFPENKLHFATLYYITTNEKDYDGWEGAVELKEPEKCYEWNWFDIDNLPSPLFGPIKNLLKCKNGDVK